MSEPRFLYRITDGWDPYSSPPVLSRYRIVRETARCFVIGWDFNPKTNRPGEKFVLKDQNGRRWAYATVEGAISSYRRRKAMQIRLGRHAIARAERCLQLLDEEGAIDIMVRMA